MNEPTRCHQTLAAVDSSHRCPACTYMGELLRLRDTLAASRAENLRLRDALAKAHADQAELEHVVDTYVRLLARERADAAYEAHCDDEGKRMREVG